MNFNVSFPGLNIDLVINRVAFYIGDFPVYWYGILIASGLMLALLYANANAHRFGVDTNKLFDCVIVGIITAIIGARTYYVLFRWEYFSTHPNEILDIRDGGIAIYGAIIGALIGGLTVAKIKKMKILPVLDITMICFLIGQAIGRWGNFFNQEAFGIETDSIFRMVSENTGGVGVHPCFLYESVWCALSFLFLHIFNRKFQKYHGQIFYLYLVLYGFERMIVEGLRTDSLYLPFKIASYQPRVSQVLSLVLLIVGIVMLIINRKKDDNVRALQVKKPKNKRKAGNNNV